MLFYLPLSGSTFKKIYYDDLLGRAVSKFIPADDLIVPYSANSLEDAEAIVHVLKMSENELRKQQVSGFYKDIEILPSEYQTDDIKRKYDDMDGTRPNYADKVVKLYEFHTSVDLIDFAHYGAICAFSVYSGTGPVRYHRGKNRLLALTNAEPPRPLLNQ